MFTNKDFCNIVCECLPYLKFNVSSTGMNIILLQVNSPVTSQDIECLQIKFMYVLPIYLLVDLVVVENIDSDFGFKFEYTTRSRLYPVLR